MPYDPKAIEPKWQARWEARAHLPRRDRSRAPEVLRARHVPVPVRRRPARRPPRGLHRHRHPGAATSACAASTSCTRWAGTPSACPPSSTPIETGMHPRETTRAQHRQLPAPDQVARLQLRLGARGRHHRPATTTAGRSGSSCSSSRAASPTRPRCRSTGARRSAPCWPTRRSSTASSERGGHPVERAADAPVDAAHHRLRRAPARRPRGARLARVDQGDAAQLDRPQRGRARSSFAVAGPRRGEFEVFTTRPDTLFGATYMVLAPEHPLVAQITTPSAARRGARPTSRPRAGAASASARPTRRRRPASFTGAFAVNPVNGERDPDLDRRLRARSSYGTGAIMAVPGARRARLRVRARASACRSSRWCAAATSRRRGLHAATASR